MSIEEVLVVRQIRASVPVANEMDPLTLDIKMSYKPDPEKKVGSDGVFLMVQNSVQDLAANNSFQSVSTSLHTQLLQVVVPGSKMDVQVKVERGPERFISEIKRKAVA